MRHFTPRLTADDFVDEICGFLFLALREYDLQEEVRVFQYEEKPKEYRGVYLAVNALPMAYGRTVSECAVNVNLHIPSMSDGTYDRRAAQEWTHWLTERIPLESAFEDGPDLPLRLARYTITTVSQPLRDRDNTHYINFRLTARFINTKKPIRL